MKSKTSQLTLSIFISLIMFLLSNYILNSLIYSIVLMVVSFVLSMMSYKCFLKENNNNKAIKSINQFVNYIETSIDNNDFYSSYLSIMEYFDNEFSNMDEEDYLNQLEQISISLNEEYFIKYVNTLKFSYENNMDLSILAIIRKQINLKTDNIKRFNKIKKKKLFSLSLMYIIFLLNSVILKITLKDIFSLMINNQIYQMLYFIIFLSSFVVYFFSLKKYLSTKVWGVRKIICY